MSTSTTDTRLAHVLQMFFCQRLIQQRQAWPALYP